MRRRSSRLLVAMLVLGVALVAGPMTMALAQTADESGPGVFDATADAAGIGVLFGNPNSGGTPDPVASGLVPNATAELGAGPAGRALSSIMWPGALAGNAGTLAGLVGVPLPPEVLANGNYPVKAEASASGGDRDEQTVGPMNALVDGASSTAHTAITDFNSPAVVSAARIVTKSRSFLEDGKVIAIAETTLQGLEIGGLIKIDTVKTTARAETDGSQATTDHDVVIAGVTVQGQGATIDEKGLHLGASNADNPLTPVVAGANQALAGAGMEAFLTKPLVEENDGGGARVNTGAVIFHWKLGDAGDYLTVVLGGSTASLKATPGSAFGLEDIGGFGGAGGVGDGFGAPGALPVVDAGAPSIDSPGSSSGAGGTDVVVPVGFTSSSPVSDRVPLGWMLIGLIGMALVGSSLHRLRTRAIEAALVGSTCPLERGAS